MTIEAALLMPLVWFVMFFILYSGFLQYDRCIGEQDCKILLLRVSNMRDKKEEEITWKWLEKGELAGQKKILFSNPEKEFHVVGKKAKVKIKGGVKTILHHLSDESGMRVFSYGAEYETERYDPIGLIRTCRRMEKYAGS